ncbi:START-like domain, Bet v I type allergen [Artemisia annua]|uniref:START-like domain, Bet v I type allergen n=1 Tax=Artemisia annua TaxID=35608 RepID=A0A2U1PL25_ARTAN|nr:START-like domain, Bet v I type allergen [Artemisia annua]
MGLIWLCFRAEVGTKMDRHSQTLLKKGKIVELIKVMDGFGCISNTYVSSFYCSLAVDTSNLSQSYTFFEGDNLMGILDSVKADVKIVPSANGGSVFKQKITYNCKDDEKPSAETLNFKKNCTRKLSRLWRLMPLPILKNSNLS